VQVECCEFLVSIFRWSKPPHHVKVNSLGEVVGSATQCLCCCLQHVSLGAKKGRAIEGRKLTALFLVEKEEGLTA
jgi:hypothetical protein